MSRELRLALGIGAAGLLLWLLVKLLGGAVMPAYLGGWLFWVALPLGALPSLMVLELVGGAALPLAWPLRRMLPMLPVALLLAIPIMLEARGLFGRPGYAAGWMAPWLFSLRLVVMLLIWTGLALIFARPPRPGTARRAWAVLGLGLHLVLVTVAGVDWVMGVTPGLGSTEIGLLLMSAQIGAALATAVLVTTRRHGVPRGAAPILLLSIGAWLFLHYVQFLVVWSADLPREIVWYQARDSGLGAAARWLALLALVAALALLLPRPLVQRRWAVIAVAALALFAHLVEMLWLVTPSFRGHFSITLADLLALAGIGGLAVAAVLVGERRPAHGPA